MRVRVVAMGWCVQVACAPDLEKLCADVSKDHSHTLLCLRSHRDNLSKACQEEELRFSIMESSDIRLTPTLMNACGQGTIPPPCPQPLTQPQTQPRA